jgi:hypothetical protein
MRMFTPIRHVAFFAIAFAQLAGCATYKVDPGEVVVKRFAETPQGTSELLEMPQVTATFTLRSDTNGDGPTRLSAGGTRDGVTGGACLLFRPVENPAACSTPADCEFVTGAGTVAESSSSGACLSYELSHGVPDSPLPEKVCWYKKEDSCVRSPVEVLTLDKVVYLPAVDAFPMGRNRPMLWRVISCQNLTDSDCGNPAAQDGINRRARFGPVTLVE